MKKIHLSIIFSLITALNASAQQEIEVIPYKIANPTGNFTSEHGKEYAKLISIASAINKDIIIYQHGKTDAALKKLAINPQRIITENDLIMIGEMGSADYILTGTLSKTKGNYKSDSVLYSLRDKRILSRSHVSAANLFILAQEEMNDIFYNFSNRKRLLTDSHVDAAILIDLSYKIGAEWESTKKGIKEFADAISDSWTIDTMINIIPFSDKYSVSDKILGLSSLPSIEKKLMLLNPKGNSSAINFEKTLRYSVKEIPWRRNSDKILIIISNSDSIEGNFFEKYALSAKMNKITVCIISLGLLKNDSIEPLKEFSAISAGLHNTVTYHQRFYNEKGSPIDAFYEAGRIFHSLVYNDSWKEGLFQDNKEKKFSNWEKPKSYLSEIFYDEKKYNINPYNLNKYYPIISESKIINYTEIENNIDSIMLEIGETFEYSAGKLKYKKPVAKVHISDGQISLWITLKDDEDLDFFLKKEAENSYFPIGVIIKKNSNEPYGITLDPNSYITEFTNEYIPKIIKTNLNDIVKNPDYYISNGLFTPPFWFIDIKVERIEKYKREYDIRETGPNP